jgi:hypothetical protein
LEVGVGAVFYQQQQVVWMMSLYCTTSAQNNSKS